MCLTNHSVSFTKTFSNLLRLILNTMNYQVPDLQGHKFFLLPPNNMYLPKKYIYIEKKKQKTKKTSISCKLQCTFVLTV